VSKGLLTADLFESAGDTRPSQEPMAERALLLRGLANAVERELVADIAEIVAQAPFRHMVTPGGHPMSVAMTNCGCYGWVTDRGGYRYDAGDPLTGRPWPAMPSSFRWGCRPFSCSPDWRAATDRAVTGWSMATSRYGAARRGWSITASRRSPAASIF